MTGYLLLVEFTLSGTPPTKDRPRHGNGRTYTPATTLEAEERIRWTFLAARRSTKTIPMIPKPTTVRLEIDAYLPNARARDWDNIGKIVSDALNEIAYTDDSQIMEAEVKKKIDRKDPRTTIRVFAIEEDPV